MINSSIFSFTNQIIQRKIILSIIPFVNIQTLHGNLCENILFN